MTPFAAFLTPASSEIRSRRRTLGLPGGGSVRVPVRYGILVHPDLGPVLVDTGYTRALGDVPGLAAAAYRRLLAPAIEARLEPIPMLAAMGYWPGDVRHVVLTHLHPDHACGLGDFAHATIHLAAASGAAWAARPRLSDMAHGLMRGLLPAFEDMRLSAFEAGSPSSSLAGSFDVLGDGSLAAVPLPGHMEGHFGLAFEVEGERVLYAADAAWTFEELGDGRTPPFPLGATVADRHARLASLGRIRAMAADGWTAVLCHDPSPTRWDVR